LPKNALKRSKTGGNGAKNAFTVYGVTVPWQQYSEVRKLRDSLENFEGLELSASYLYSLFEIMEQADRAEREQNPKDSIWRSHLYYRTSRMLERAKVTKETGLRFIEFIADAVNSHRAAVRIPLSTLFYRKRNS